MNFATSLSRAVVQQNRLPKQDLSRQQIAQLAAEYSDESDTTEDLSDDDSFDADRNEIFLQEYFHQQYLRMQAIYPPSFKSKEKKFEGNCIINSQNNNYEESTISFPNDKPKTTSSFIPQRVGDNSSNKGESAISQKRTVSSDKKHGELSDIILDSLGKLGIVFNRRRSV